MKQTRRRNVSAYHTRQFINAKNELRDGWHECWVTDDNGKCHRRGTVPDHYPPLATFPDPSLWHGELLPMCRMHSTKQGGMQNKNRAYLPLPSRSW